MITKFKPTGYQTSALLFGFSLILFLVVPVFAKGKDTAPGQNKVAPQNSNSDRDVNSNQNKSNIPENKKVIIGSVEKVIGNDITVQEISDRKKTQITLDKKTQVIGQGNKDSKLGAIKLKDLIAFVSTDSAEATGGGKLNVKRIFIKNASESAQIKRNAIQGVIIDINGDIINLAHQIHRDRTYKVIKNNATVISGKAIDFEITEATDSASTAILKVGQRIVAVGDLNDTGAILAKRIHIIPGKATGIFNRLPVVSTPSASMTATPAASATVSATVTPEASVVPSESPYASLLSP